MEIFDRPMPSDNAHRRSLGDTVDLREVLAKFWIRKWFIVAATLICAGLAFSIAKLITPAYTGEAFVMIKPLQPGEPATDASVRAAIQGGPEAVPTEVFVLRSRALASETIERLHLDRDPEFDPSLRRPGPLPALLDPVTVLFDKALGRLQAITGLLSSATDVPTTSDEVPPAAEADKSAAAGGPTTGVVNAFMTRLHVTIQERSNVIQVSFNSSRPKTAALVPNTIIQLYLAHGVSEKDKALAQESERLDNVILPALRQKMQASEFALAAYRQKSGLVSDQNPTVLGQELSETKAQLAIARARTAEAAVRLSQAQPAYPSGVASPTTAAESPTLQRLREQEVNFEGQLAALRISLGANNPKTLQVAGQLKEVREGMRREGAGLVGRLKGELAAAQVTEAALNRKVAEFTHQFAEVNGGDAQLQSLIGEADADRKAYERYLARSKELHSSMGHAQPDASLVSRADVPLNPSFPDTRTMVMVGATIGAGAGMVLVAMIPVLLGGLRSKDQVEDALGVKCLGLVPKLKRSRRRRSRAPELETAIETFSLLQPRSTAFGQAIRGAQLKLLSVDRRTDSQVVLVTAALPREGKTWAAVCLAASLAADGFRVVLVDCDLHRPTVHRMFDGPRGPGLTDYFSGDAAFDEIVHIDRNSGVSYVPAGMALRKAAWRITSDRLRPLIDRLGENYSFIILDSAPVLAVSETILLSQIAQKTILVVKWGSTPPAVARHAAMQLLESGGAEIAVLLSMVNTRRAAKYGDPVAAVYKRIEKYYHPIHDGRLPRVEAALHERPTPTAPESEDQREVRAARAVLRADQRRGGTLGEDAGASASPRSTH
jgi:succinoglycan biosynthesis transport protein ExoP